ncbi:twin-arginine translocase subunit TatC [Algiphilus sp. W345]|uniref:Sec-independent protein translocase protein TatC n=1 Tax=Banduia mediterranea TaxID=3075609 RepID=A0ABU2WIY0_9GAMM|nr:twin-arginine translocase subunit TatC [Algiphilus sp. W345]MDT0497822.1 twin-arginine translocase subunit TatC [Algiphilus sp. W345]
MSKDASSSGEQPLIAHLLELRTRLLRALIGVLIVFIPLAYFAKDFYRIVAAPLMQLMPAGTGMIATEVASPFFAPFKLAGLAALVIALPWVLYQTWAFIAPGLYKNEQRLVVPLLATSSALFYVGMLFAYFVVFPIVFGFFVKVAPEGVTVMTDISRYLDFVITMFLAFGAAFETPVAIVLLVKTGFVTPADLAAKRAYVLVGTFLLSAFLTPPDIFSQLLLAGPAYLLFEIGIVWARILVPGAREVEAQRRGE